MGLMGLIGFKMFKVFKSLMGFNMSGSKFHFSLLTLSLFILSACSYIGEEERLIYVKPEPAERVVLLEDFTGQRCVNCPKGTEVIEQLQQAYGDNVIAVGIHGGPLAFAGNARYEGLSTDAGNEYYNHWGFDYQPIGLVNRHGAVNYTDWAAAVREELSKPAPLSLSVDAVLQEDGHIDITLAAYGTDGVVEGKLQVWLLEDSIAALQLMPDGTPNTSYNHNHVLRAPVNGLWGEDFTITEGEWKELQMTFLPDAAWKPQHLSIVAFVYNNQGVQQAAHAKIQKL